MGCMAMGRWLHFWKWDLTPEASGKEERVACTLLHAGLGCVHVCLDACLPREEGMPGGMRGDWPLLACGPQALAAETRCDALRFGVACCGRWRSVRRTAPCCCTSRCGWRRSRCACRRHQHAVPDSHAWLDVEACMLASTQALHCKTTCLPLKGSVRLLAQPLIRMPCLHT